MAFNALRRAAACIAALGVSACGSSSASPFTAKPATSPPPDRTIEVTADDRLRFVPSAIAVRPGETVAFHVTNTGAVPHEFVIGDTHDQDQHEREMQSMGAGVHMGSEPGAADLAPGAAATVVYTFPRTGTLVFGCHVTGHYAGGMKGVITIA